MSQETHNLLSMEVAEMEKNNESQAPSADGLQFFTPGRDVAIELGVKCTKIKTQTVVLIGVVYFHIIYRCFVILCRSLWFCCSLFSSIHLLYFEQTYCFCFVLSKHSHRCWVCGFDLSTGQAPQDGDSGTSCDHRHCVAVDT